MHHIYCYNRNKNLFSSYLCINLTWCTLFTIKGQLNCFDKMKLSSFHTFSLDNKTFILANLNNTGNFKITSSQNHINNSAIPGCWLCYVLQLQNILFVRVILELVNPKSSWIIRTIAFISKH